jgi:alpha-beta hydrolase superfamily lysophospholipase
MCAGRIVPRRVFVAAHRAGRPANAAREARLLLLYGAVQSAASGVIEGRAAVERDGVDALSLREAPPPAWIQSSRGYAIPVRRFGAGGTGRPVVMVHGLESHSGWFVQSARRIATLGLPVHSFDRAGSGVSEADGDRWCRLDDLLAEVDAVADAALAEGRHHEIHLIGHCFGAIVALLYAALHRPERVASLALATPALYTHTDLDTRAKLRVLWSVIRRRDDRIAIPLSPGDFSELAPFVEIVRGDPLVLRTAPARLFYEIRRARRRLREAAGALRAPLLTAMAGDDPICDNRRNRQLLGRVTAKREIHEYPGTRHILEFSGARDVFLADLAAWYQRQESA